MIVVRSGLKNSHTTPVQSVLQFVFLSGLVEPTVKNKHVTILLFAHVVIFTYMTQLKRFIKTNMVLVFIFQLTTRYLNWQNFEIRQN